MLLQKVTLDISYDKSDDIAYIYFEKIDKGEIDNSITIDETPANGSDLALDYAGSTIKGIEVIGASKTLPESILKHFI